MIRSMGRILRRLRNTLVKDKSGAGAEVLRRVSQDFRTFLGFLSAVNCRAMVPREFLGLSFLTGFPEDPGQTLSGEFLCDIFRRCDTLRFGGGPIEGAEVIGILDDCKKFTDALDRREREPRRFSGTSNIPAEGAV
jgi:hypothetical protein